MSLTWRKSKGATGLAAVCQGPLGYELRWNGQEIASVEFSRGNDAWFWSCASNTALGLPHYNSFQEKRTWEDIEEAKANCFAWVKSRLVEPVEAAKLTIGQTLWYVNHSRSGAGQKAVVESVSRVYAVLSNGWRVNRITLRAVDKYGDPAGICYTEEGYQAYLEQKKLALDWDKFTVLIRGRNRPPEGVTVADIEKAAALLKIKLD